MEEIFVDNLRKTFGNVTAVDIPSLKIQKGDLVGLVGNNGAGKTTLLRLMLDLSCPTDGSVVLEGINPGKSEEWKQWTGAYLDDGFLIDFLTPDEYFEFVAKANGVDATQLKEFESSMTSFVDDNILGQNKYIRSFSAGNKQKIGIMAAMIGEPRILILDEPFNFLDPSGQVHLKKILVDYSKRHNATIIVSSHNLQHVVDISSRVLVMESGHIIKDIDNAGQKAAEELKDYFSVR